MVLHLVFAGISEHHRVIYTLAILVITCPYSSAQLTAHNQIYA